MPSERRFHLAGMEALLRSARPLALPPPFSRYPGSGAPPSLVLDVEQVPGFGEGREQGPDYPGFRRRLVGRRRIELSRFDAEGWLEVPESEGPVRGAFRVGESPHSLEATLRLGASLALPRLGGLLLHASAVVVRGEALVFAGESGAGKSTLSSLLDAALPGAEKVADEILVVRSEARGRWHLHVPPFVGREPVPHGLRRPLRGLYLLAQAPRHEKTALAAGDGVRQILRHVLAYIAEPESARRVLGAAAQLAADVPCYRLEFARDPGVAEVLGIT